MAVKKKRIYADVEVVNGKINVGYGNTIINADKSSITGGANNSLDGEHSVISGGINNTISDAS